MASDKALYDLHHADGLSYGEIAKRLGLSKSSVRGRVGRHKRKLAKAAPPTPKVLRLADVMPLYDASPFDDTDWNEWLSVVARLRKLPRMTRVMLWNDMHMPDHDPQAVALAFQVAAAFEPDVCVVGSDAFDFDVLSTKYPRRYNRIRRDAFSEVRPYWHTFVSTLKGTLPGATLVAIGDNHASGRVEKYVNERAAELGDTILASFNDLVRADGRVLWLGYQQELRLFSALFEHGLKAGENAAKNSLKQRGWGTPKAQGHGHTPQWYTNIIDSTALDGASKYSYPVTSIMTGHLANRQAHYQQHTDASRWVQGVGLAHVHPREMEVHFQNLIFYPRRDGSLSTTLGRDELVERKPRLTLQKTYTRKGTVNVPDEDSADEEAA